MPNIQINNRRDYYPIEDNVIKVKQLLPTYRGSVVRFIFKVLKGWGFYSSYKLKNIFEAIAQDPRLLYKLDNKNLVRLESVLKTSPKNQSRTDELFEKAKKAKIPITSPPPRDNGEHLTVYTVLR